MKNVLLQLFLNALFCNLNYFHNTNFISNIVNYNRPEVKEINEKNNRSCTKNVRNFQKCCEMTTICHCAVFY